MNFLIFIWNTFAKLAGNLMFIVYESFIFYIIITILNGAGLQFLSYILTPVFFIWIIIDVFLRLFVGGTKSLFRYIFKY